MKKLFVFMFMTFTIACFQPASALSGLDAGSINAQDVFDLRLHDMIKREQAKSEKFKKEEKPSEQLQNLNKTALTDIKHISFINNNSVTSRELFRVIENYINQPMNVENVSSIRKAIMKYYQNKGYYSAIALIKSENTQTGELVLDIKEGGKNSITVQP